MSTVHSSSKASRPTLVIDDFEEGWDCGVAWANERAAYRSLRLVQQLHIHRCRDLSLLVASLGCKAVDLFGRETGISKRRLEGFIEGAVAILHEDGV